MLSGRTITRESRYNLLFSGYLLLSQLIRSLNNIYAHIKSCSSPFISLLCPLLILSHTLFLNLPFCACPPLMCSHHTEGRSALEQLYFLLTCSFPSPTPASSACLVLHSTGKGALPEWVPPRQQCPLSCLY